jgi:thymidine phosphorylase
MIVIPIIAAAGITIPKTSSRAITSPSGTADTMETMCNVTNDAKKLQKILEKVGAFITWGGGVDLAAADDRLIRVRHPMSLDPKGMMLASIMAKKYAVGSTHVLIDIPYGPQVKTKTLADAMNLKKDFERLGKMLGMKVRVIATHGDSPIGRGIGPVLEAIDVMQVLENDPDAPKDLREKAVFMAGELLELCGKAKRGQGGKLAVSLLTSGRALRKMNEIIDAQGRKKMAKPGKITHDILAEKSGKISGVNNKLISHIARVAGAPKNPGAGLIIRKNLNETVKKGDTLFTIHAENIQRLKNAIEEAKNETYNIK